MKVIYVAGPFRGETAWAIHQNVARAEQLALRVAKLGAMPLCPHKNTENFHGELTDDFWIEGTKELLRRCDAVIMTEYWQDSAGAKGEFAEAERLGIRVFLTLYSLGQWLRGAEGHAVQGGDR